MHTINRYFLLNHYLANVVQFLSVFCSPNLKRWWPAEVSHPKTIPENIQRMRHDVGEFPVHFFGSNDYLWTYQARVFPYMDVDANSKEKMGKGVDATYKKGIQWAQQNVFFNRSWKPMSSFGWLFITVDLPPQLWRRQLCDFVSCRRRRSSVSFKRIERTIGSPLHTNI